LKGNTKRLGSLKLAFHSLLGKEKIEELERRLAGLRTEIQLHVAADLRFVNLITIKIKLIECCRARAVQFISDEHDRLDDLDSRTKRILEAIVNQQDNLLFLEDTQLTIWESLKRQQQRMTVEERELYISKLPNVAEAAFGSFETRHDPLCLEDTRVDLLHEIQRWGEDKDERCIFWLNGLAGTGKSTIARTVAKGFSQFKASFIFSRSNAELSHTAKFFTSIAVQLANQSPILKRLISEAVSERNDIARQSLQNQWHHLIVQPLSKLDNSFQDSLLLIVVDALDECEDQDDIEDIVRLFAEAHGVTTIRLRIFLTSRPEVPIRHGFSKISNVEPRDFILHNINPATADHDIFLFLEHGFKDICQGHGFPTGWPRHDDIQKLTSRSSGLFVWASTAFKFIREGRRFGPKRLSLLLLQIDKRTRPRKSNSTAFI